MKQKWFFILLIGLFTGFGAAGAAANLVQNGDFEGIWTPDGTGDSIPAGWTKDESRDPPESSTIGEALGDNGPSQPGTSSAFWSRPSGGGSGDHTIFRQPLSILADQYSELRLSLDVKVISHNLEAGGTVSPAFEWPVRLEILYTLQSNPAVTQLWRYGWFIDPPGDSFFGPIDDPGSGIIPIYNDTLVAQGIWISQQFDLLAELPDLGEIIRITIGGAGHSFEGQADNISITGKFWKRGFNNYAPSGMPDFSQKQSSWAHQILCAADIPVPMADTLADPTDVQTTPQGLPCGSPRQVVVDKGLDSVMQTLADPRDVNLYEYCLPTAVANCLWWFDSKEELDQGGGKCDGFDTYDMVTIYPAATDDHCEDNVDEPTTPPGADPITLVPFGELVEDLAWRMDTGGQRTLTPRFGTAAADAEAAIRKYIRDRGLEEDYLVRLVRNPDFNFIANELGRSQDIILLLAFTQNCPSGQRYIGGHAVTTAGVNTIPANLEVCLSDPFFDMAEAGGLGRVPAVHAGHAGSIPDKTHNDAKAVSHDCYPVSATAGPYGTIELTSYGTLIQPGEDPTPTDCTDIENFDGQNQWDPSNPDYETFPCDPSCGPIITTVAFVLEISPTEWFWKADGWVDYAPSGMPDFDQKQDNFKCPVDGTWSYCGPTAVANSFWWFDSVKEPNPLPPSVGQQDGYPLVQWPPGAPFDDHAPDNVEPLIKDLSAIMNTDNQNGAPVPAFCGTFADDMKTGVEQWLQNVGLDNDYYVNLIQSPSYDFVADEVEKSQDVVLLLGFWQMQASPFGIPQWFRVGGHYVTVAGVDRTNRLVAFSDPILDTAEAGTGIGGRVRGPAPHGHPLVPPDTTHNDAQKVSHDAYRAVPTNSPGGIWGPEGYVEALGPTGLGNFLGQNTSQDLNENYPMVPPAPTPEPIVTEVDYALEVSPCPPDLDEDGFRPICDGDCDDTDPDINPGHPEVCDGKDNDCNGLVDEGTPDFDGDGVCDLIDNCPNTWNPAQVDSDGDGAGDVCDCEPAIPGITGPVGEVTGLLFAAGSLTDFFWVPEPQATRYYVYRGQSTITNGWIGCNPCMDPLGTPVPNDSDTTLYGPGDFICYIPTAYNSCGEGPKGWDSAGNLRPNLTSCVGGGAE